MSLVSIVTLIIALVVPQLTKCIKMLIEEIPDALKLVVAQLDKFEFVPDDIIGFLSGIDWQSKITSIVSTITSGVGSIMTVVISTVSTVVSGVTTTVLSVIFAIYVLLSKDNLLTQLKTLIKHYLPKKVSETVYDRLLSPGYFNGCFKC